MRAITPQIHEAGAELVIIGNGSPQQAQWFIEDTGVQTPVFTDPDRKTYALIGARRGWRAVLHPQVVTRSWQAWRNGRRQTAVMGDPTQIGGLCIVRPDGTVPFLHRSAYAGDALQPSRILQELERVAARTV